VLAILGESGSGKSVSAAAIMNLIDSPPGYVTAGRILYRGEDLLAMSAEARRRINGRKIAMIFQDTLAALNPVYPVGWQIAEGLRAHGKYSKKEARQMAIDVLRRVGIPDPEHRVDHYPHQFSGGQKQRIVIAQALVLDPGVIIADEPTTALDVTVQAEILDLLRRCRDEFGTAIVLITHNMGVVAETAQRVIVMYAGQIMEERDAASLFSAPQHPYTAALLEALPERSVGDHRLATIPGVVPGLYDRPQGCLFSPRCAYATEHSRRVQPELRPWMGGQIRCHYPFGDPGRSAKLEADRLVGAEPPS
jgi:dipeptide transport system ATP-binding protein